MHTVDEGDDITLSATNQSQITQSLLLFSQAQSGRRYTPHQTRFYASIPPEALMVFSRSALGQLGVKARRWRARLRVGGYDRRKVMFKVWVEIEHFVYGGTEGSFCMTQRDEGNPIAWRLPHVLRG